MERKSEQEKAASGIWVQSTPRMERQSEQENEQENAASDTVETPRQPDLRCQHHEAMTEVVHSLLGRLMELEARVAALEADGD